MKLLITGGAGFIGANFIYHQLQHHPEDRFACPDLRGNLENLSLCQRENFSSSRVISSIGSCWTRSLPGRRSTWSSTSRRRAVDNSITNPEVFLRTNVMGTQALMDACRKYGVGRYHQVSTDEVYGDLPLDRPDLFFTEQTPLNPLALLGLKASADLLGHGVPPHLWLPATISRCSNNYGPYQFPEKLIPLMISRRWRISPAGVRLGGGTCAISCT